MPKLGKYTPLLNSVFFLYGSKEDAESGTDTGGTGFLVAVPHSSLPGCFYIHGVTNWHVAVAYMPSPCIRMNTHLGTPIIFEFDASEWFFKPDSYDIAVSPPLKIDHRLHKVAPIDLNSFFLTPQEEIDHEINPAEDVFMIGRFVDYCGVEVNTPALRFGHISIMDAKIKQLTGYSGRSIVLDMNSRTGFSGSPVFVYRTLGSHFMEAAMPGQVLTGGGHYMKLLGMHWGQFPERWELKSTHTESYVRQNSLITEGKYVLGLSGMTCVIPAANIVEVLNLPEVKESRTEIMAVKF